jgi:hypothetical protein
MASKSYYLSTSLLDFLLRRVAFTAPVGIYVGLFTTIPTPGSGGVEVSGGGYVRQAATWNPAVNGTSSNAALVTFSPATFPWGTVVAFGLFDAASGGNLLYFAPMNAPRTIQLNDQILYPAGQLVVTET